MELAHVIEVGEGDFEARVVEASRQAPVVVDFWAGWCRPCLVLSPILERQAEQYAGRFTLAKVDVDANPGLATRFGVQGIPAVKAFRDGRVVSEFVGVQPEDAVRRFLDELLPTEADELAVGAEAAASSEEAEIAYRRALELDPGHPKSAIGLARLLLGKGEASEARSLLERMPGNGEARRLRSEAELRLAAEADGDLGAAARDAVAGNPRAALERCMTLISEGGDMRDAARDTMLRVFETLGDDHPLTREYRSRLASALF